MSSHGEYDNIDEAITMINNVKKVILNCGELNGLEHNLIKTLNVRK